MSFLWETLAEGKITTRSGPRSLLEVVVRQGGVNQPALPFLSLLAAALRVNASAMQTAEPTSGLALVVVLPSLMNLHCCIDHACFLLPDFVTTSAQLDPGDFLCL